MFARFEIGRIGGIPIYLDMMFVLVLLFFTYPYFTSGSTRAMSAGFVNGVLTVFNLLPAYPLDGGHTLDAWLSKLLGPIWSVRIIASLGLACAAWLAYMAIPTNLYLLFIAFFLALLNWQKLQGLGRWQR
jgi:Zn-dependent protease